MRSKLRLALLGNATARGMQIFFTVALDFEIEVSNNSKNTLFLRSDMIQSSPSVLLQDLETARRGSYMYESGAGTSVWYGDHKFPPVREIRILPGRSARIRIGGGVLARYKPDFPYPKAVPPGRYALQLLLRPKKSSAPQSSGTQVSYC